MFTYLLIVCLFPTDTLRSIYCGSTLTKRLCWSIYVLPEPTTDVQLVLYTAITHEYHWEAQPMPICRIR